MALTTGALAASAAVGLLSAGVSGYMRNKGNKTQNAFYDYARDVAQSEQHNSIFTSPYGQALLKLQDTQDRKSLDALDNRMVAGGATMENQLAARQSLNEGRDRTNMQLLQYDDANRRAWKNKELDIAGQQAQFNANRYYQAAQDWNQWGGQMAGSLMSLGSTGLLGGAAAGAVNPADVIGSGANVYGGAVAGSGAQINPGQIPSAAEMPIAPGGLRLAPPKTLSV